MKMYAYAALLIEVAVCRAEVCRIMNICNVHSYIWIYVHALSFTYTYVIHIFVYICVV